MRDCWGTSMDGLAGGTLQILSWISNEASLAACNLGYSTFF